MILDLKILGGRSCQFNVPDDARVKYLKDLVEKENKILKSQQKLVFKGKTLGDEKQLSEYGITTGCKLNLVVKKNPTTVSDSASASTTNASHPGSSKETRSYDIEDFWKTLETVLSKRFSKMETGNILQQYRCDYKKILTTISLDDIERIAARRLNSST